jgi:hypothetical protein
MGNACPTGQVPYPGTWMQAPHLPEAPKQMGLSPDSTGKTAQRQKRKLYDHSKRDRSASGKKPHTLEVKVGGEIDAGCDGKNVRNAALRLHIPQVLDISIIDWDVQKPESLQLLREKLDEEFEYVGNRLGTQGFRNAIKRYLKLERSHLKVKFLNGQTDCPLHVEPQ